MSATPPRWTVDELNAEVKVSAAIFRDSRLAPTAAWKTHYDNARVKFESLFNEFNDLQLHILTDEALACAYAGKLGEALRYLAGPPISDDDLQVLADVDSLTPSVLSKDPVALRQVFSVIEQVIDPYRFPWIIENRQPTPEEKSAALLASSVLLAAQRIATERRSTGKTGQEQQVKDYLTSIGFTEVNTQTVTTLVKGPGQGQFCGECLLGARKADVLVRLHDTRLMPIECKVSNSSTNSVKRVNNDAAAKAEYWLKQFGEAQVVPAAMLSGVFKALNLAQAQDRGLTLWWAHDLAKLGDFIESTTP